MPRSSREKSIETRIRILEAAYRLFIENGYNATAMRAISKVAGVTVGAIYNHFQTKEDIWREVLRTKHPYHELFPLFLDAKGESIAQIVQSVAHGMVDELRKRPDYLNLMFIEIVEFRSKHIPELFQMILPDALKLLNILENKRGRLRGIPPVTLARSFGGLFFSFYVTEIFMKSSGYFTAEDDSLDHYIDLYLYGILEDNEVIAGEGL